MEIESATTISETEIFSLLDKAFKGEPNQYYPPRLPNHIHYNFFPDLEDGYRSTAGSRIHLYGDSMRWAVVFETNGYHNHAFSAMIELDYVGNCINYPVENQPKRTYISNQSHLVLISSEEYERIENKKGRELENFELVSADIKQIQVRDKTIPFNSNSKDYEKLGVEIQDFDNPHKLIGFKDLVRYLHETSPEVISATEEDIKAHIPYDLPKIMTIDAFHFNSFYDKETLPSQQETYQLIAKVIVNQDSTYWKPTQPANNHWSNWESGNL